jgi:hypothetical protein
MEDRRHVPAEQADPLPEGWSRPPGQPNFARQGIAQPVVPDAAGIAKRIQEQNRRLTMETRRTHGIAPVADYLSGPDQVG